MGDILRTGCSRAFTAADFSGEFYTLRPAYKNDKIPLQIEEDDRIFDPRIDKATTMPKRIGRLAFKNRFSKIADGLESTNYWILLKAPQSDIYHIPEEASAFREFIKKAVDYEHNSTPLAFTRAATLYVHQNCATDAQWHYDTYTGNFARHYLCTSKEPATGFLKLLFSKVAREGVSFDGSYSALEALTDDKGLANSPLEQLKIKRHKPFDITRHSSSALHIGTPDHLSDQRTCATLSYHTMTTDKDYERHMWRHFENRERIFSAPPDKAAALLQEYMSRRDF